MAYTVVNVEVIDQTLQVTNLPKLASGGDHETQIRATFCDMWASYGKTVVFYREKKGFPVYHVVMVDNACLIPREVMAEPGKVFFAILGVSGESTRTTEAVALTIERGVIVTAIPVPLPDVYAQLLSAYGEVTQAIKVERARLDTLIAEGTPPDGELADIRTGYDGTKYNLAGEAVRKQIVGILGKTETVSTSAVDINAIVQPGQYVVSVSDAQNSPIQSSFALIVETMHNRWIVQRAHSVYTASGASTEFYYRYGQNLTRDTVNTNFAAGLNTIWGEWRKIVDKKALDSAVGVYSVISESGFNLDTLTYNARFVVTSADTVNKPPIDTGYILRVERIGAFTVQNAFALLASSKQFYRIGQENSSGLKWGSWVEVGNANKGMTVVMMGDSIVGNYVNGKSPLSEKLSEASGAVVYNCGFGGCRMSSHSSTRYRSFSMWKLADAIAEGDFIEQDISAADASMPDYFPSHVETLKSLDFSSVDIVTIGYGTNDFTSETLLDNSDDPKDVTTFGGAMRYSIERLLTKYPHLRIVLVAPTWRWWRDDAGTYLYDSDTHEIAGQKLHQFVEKTIEIANEYHLPVVNPYDEMGINRFNRSLWFADGTHPNIEGQKILAKLISKTLAGM